MVYCPSYARENIPEYLEVLKEQGQWKAETGEEDSQAEDTWGSLPNDSRSTRSSGPRERRVSISLSS